MLRSQPYHKTYCADIVAHSDSNLDALFCLIIPSLIAIFSPLSRGFPLCLEFITPKPTNPFETSNVFRHLGRVVLALCLFFLFIHFRSWRNSETLESNEVLGEGGIDKNLDWHLRSILYGWYSQSLATARSPIREAKYLRHVLIQ